MGPSRREMQHWQMHGGFSTWYRDGRPAQMAALGLCLLGRRQRQGRGMGP